MPTNLHLRNVSETIEDLTLDTLLRFLQAHFEEGNALDFCNRLMSMAQQFDNTKYHFVIRCVEMHQSVTVSFYLCVCVRGCVCVCVCVCVCAHARPSIVKVSSVWGWNSSWQINNVVLKTFLSSAKFFHCYFSMKHRAFLNSHVILFTH